jgi:hypothetical protein
MAQNDGGPGPSKRLKKLSVPVESLAPVPEVVHSSPNIDDTLDLPSMLDVPSVSTAPIVAIRPDSPSTLTSARTDDVLMSTRPDGVDDTTIIPRVEPSPPTSISAPTDDVPMSTRPDGADVTSTIAPVEPSPPPSTSALTQDVPMSPRPDGAENIATIAPVEPPTSEEPDVVMDIQPTTYNEADTNVSEGNVAIIDSNCHDTSSIAPPEVVPPIEEVTDSSEVSTSFICIGLCKFSARRG